MDENTVTPTSVGEVIDSFEASFQDKSIIPLELELLWLKKAVAQYSVEIEPISLADEETFDGVLDQYVIDTLAQMMKVYYMEREVSKVNKRVSIISKDISVNGGGHDKTSARAELEYNAIKATIMTANQKPTAYN